jgi:hypothetical protein
VLRPLSLLPALVAVSATLVAPGSAHASTLAADESPLSVAIDALAPSSVPSRGPIRISGSVTNDDDEPWTTVNVYSFIAAEPMTTPEELADAAQTPATAQVGTRITEPGTYDTIDRIEPGESAQFSVRVPRSAIPATEPGVYWFGVHALGEGPAGRDTAADGRARTFLPLVPRTNRSQDTALVLPLRRLITFTPDGRLTGVEGWTRALSAGGRLRSLVDFGASAGSRPITWLVDPAVPEAVRRLAAGNPPRSLAADEQPEGEDEDEGSPGPSATPDPTPDASEPPTPEAQQVPAATVEAANAWLERFEVALQASQILELPYGDLDVAAAAKQAPSTYGRARARSAAAPGSPAHRSSSVSPPKGYLDGPGLRLLEKDATVLLSDRAFLDPPPPVARTLGHRIVPTSSGAASGGPGPDDRAAPVAIRQRILSEAALRLIAPGRQPLVVELSSNWVPTATAGFFQGLDQDWLNLTSVGGATNAYRGRAVPLSRLSYPASQARRELDAGLFGAVSSLTRSGDTLDAVLSRNDTLRQTVADQGLNSLSYSSRRRPSAVRLSVERSRAWIETQVSSVRIEAPRRVTLSSASGRFSATLVNGLDQPVTVGINAVTDEPMSISGPSTVDIPAAGRTTVLLNARTSQLGIHNVTLIVTDVNGTPLGSSDQVPIRAAQVSAVIWLILGTGVALLFGAIAVRLVRRVRAATRAARAAPAARQL